MSVIVAATGCAGLVCSFALLHVGLRLMWLRYVIAIGVAYGAFLLLIGGWLAWQRRKLERRATVSGSGGSFLDIVDVNTGGGGGVARGAARLAGAGGRFGGGGAETGFDGANMAAAQAVPVPMPLGDAPGVAGHAASTGARSLAGIGGHGGGSGFELDLDDAVVIVAALAAIAAAVASSVYVVVTAPVLFAEVMFDGALSAGLYRRLRTLNHHRWWEDAIRHTAIPVAVVTVFFGIAGYLMQRYEPGASSIGAVAQHLLHK